MSRPSDLIQGTLDLLILKTVALEPKHGWAIAKRIQQMSGDVLQITQGSLYPALHRLEQQGWLKAQAGQTDTGREAKFYALTAAGRKQLARELESWDRLSTAIGLIVREAEIRGVPDVANARQIRLRLASLFRGNQADASLKGEISSACRSRSTRTSRRA